MTREEFRRFADVALSASKADSTFVAISERTGGTTRFANNAITQNVATRQFTLSITVAFGQRRGSASSTALTEAAIQDTLSRAVEAAKIAPPDPEHLPPLPPQRYPIYATIRAETASATPQRRAREAKSAIDLCRAAGVQAAGIVSSYVSQVGLAASTKLFAFEERTQAAFSLTATGTNSSGWVSNQNRSIDDLGVQSRTRVAIEKARLSADPQRFSAGRYHVILEPPAVNGLIEPLIGAMNARSYHRGTSALAGKLGSRLIDERLTLRNRPDHAKLLGDGFDGQGMPSDLAAWIDRGTLARLRYDRFTALQQNTVPTYELDAPHLSGDGASTADELLRRVARGILVTNFWYIRSVNPTDLTVTGMTRDGTFLIEDGRIVGGLHNFRFHDSPLRVFNALDGFTEPDDSVSQEQGKKLLPAMLVRDFNLSSVSEF